MYMLALTSVSLILLKRKMLFESNFMMRIYCFSVIAPVLANQAGWVATETGRQPWIVYGLMRTPEGLSKAVKANEILASIIMFTFIYILLFLVWVFVIHNKIKHGPDELFPNKKKKILIEEKS